MKKATELGINLQGVLDKSVTPTAQQLDLLKSNQIIAEYPTFAGFQITSLYEFFMVFVVLCGIAAIILAGLTPVLRRMMHGVK